ncbi:hypothetical protein NB689_000882 [Xanthomonas sacchari]|nr:hypothetical protein [Xanthomonas sacchari]MCW0415128.1 hypothetical protein [Xanthomonas sacchari]MCW0422859.1 hypothetical protein [Xanthomonas sacchari]MCW0436427.1 hypothetical protein [Xanthomonas sacchari]
MLDTFSGEVMGEVVIADPAVVVRIEPTGLLNFIG